MRNFITFTIVTNVYLVVEEVNGVLVQSKRESLEERDVVSHHFLVSML